jgi:hypothetical protein
MPIGQNALETLRQVNVALRSALVRLRPENRHCSTIGPEDFSGIRSQIQLASDCLANLSPLSKEVEVQEESLLYRSNLEKLRRCLPDAHIRLLAERSRLETLRDHLAAAASWDRATKL